jgi:GAF domain-containing protein
MQADSYLCLPLQDRDGEVLGHLAMTHNAPMAEDSREVAIFKIFASRAVAELRRMRAY